MDILATAMKMELDGKAFYLKGSAETNDKELKKIFDTLAEEEDRHFEIFKNMKDDGMTKATQLVGKLSQTNTIVRNVFKDMIDSGRSSLGGDDARALWTEALRVEEATEKTYREQAEIETDPVRKVLWDKIANEEKNHVYLISNIISFIADPKGYAQTSQYSNFMSIEGHFDSD